ncbi:hypothetical protein [Sphingomonas azotifigens]|uniref:hypothetical protein n=1 Tax=Sphingomonas azotifigens TaxID=330920 RepID=UPI000A065749|nr:hypothetical protein [Sphingomonas azotifigens]
MATVIGNPEALVKSLALPSDESFAELFERLDSAPNAAGKKILLADNQPSAQVNAGSLTSFTQRLSGENKADVQNSTLFAQLASDAAYNRYTDPMAWYKKYVEVLGGIGWNQPAFAFDTYSSGGTTVRLDEAVLGILAAIATADEIAIVKATMSGLQALGDDTKQMLIWDSRASNGNNGTFQIFPVDRLSNGDVVMVLDGMQFNASRSVTRFLWWSWESNSIRIQRAANKFVLNESIYAKVRQQIIERLGDRAKRLVADIPLGD